jgi:hypothetical protein
VERAAVDEVLMLEERRYDLQLALHELLQLLP